MQFSTAALAALFATSVVASPTWGSGGDWKDSEAGACENGYEPESVFSFDQTIIVQADPDQVRDGTQPAPGQPCAKGLFKFGINVEHNTICYV